MMLRFLSIGALGILVAGAANAAPANHGHQLENGCYCPAGTEYRKGECVTESALIVEPTCPYNMYHSQGDVCLKPVAKELGCPTGFELVPRVGCVDANKTDPIEICPTGFFLRKNRCERSFMIPTIPSCPNPQQFLQDGQCVRVAEKPAKAFCQGTGRKGKCFLVQEGNNVLECPVNYKLVGDRCEKVEFSQKVYVCHWHPNMSDNGHEDTHPTKKCPRITDVPCDDSEDYNPMARQLQQEDEGLEEAGRPHSPPYHAHSSIYTPHQKMCNRIVYYAARGRCPSGFTELTGAEPYIDSHHYDKKQKPQCVRVEIIAPNIVCLDKLIGNKCRKVVQVPFNLRCNYATFNRWSRENSHCTKIRKGNPTLSCPPNTEEVRNERGELIACKRTRSLPAKKECPVGSEEKQGECVQLTIVKPSICPSYAIQKRGMCFVKADLIYKCPNGYEPSPKDPKTCITLNTQPPICPQHNHHFGYGDYDW